MASPDASSTAESTTMKVAVKTELTTVGLADLNVAAPAQALRRSPRKRTMAKMKEEGEEKEAQNASVASRFWPSTPSPRKRPREIAAVKEEDGDSKTQPTAVDNKSKTICQIVLSSPAKKIKREYAPPEAYAHLEYLTDYLQEHLDVMFCGINPGYKSAEVGHHFAHPTNHFWRALHQSGFTDRQLKPSEDSTLPALYNVGLTDLVERPSSEQAELSLADMQNGVPTLLTKIARYRPRVICFVGKQIGEVFLKQATIGLPPPPPLGIQSTEVKKGTKSKRVKKAAVQMGFQPYKIVHTNDNATLFFIMPSTSARVTGYQLKDKVKLLSTLYDAVQRLKLGNGMSTAEMQVIPLPTITPET